MSRGKKAAIAAAAVVAGAAALTYSIMAAAAIFTTKRYNDNKKLGAGAKSVVEGFLTTHVCPAADADLGAGACVPSTQKWNYAASWDNENGAQSSMWVDVDAQMTKPGGGPAILIKRRYSTSAPAPPATRTQIENLLTNNVCPKANDELGVGACTPATQTWGVNASWSGVVGKKVRAQMYVDVDVEISKVP